MTLITAQDIIETGRQASLTHSVLVEWAEKGTPKQREYLHGMLLAEHESRQASRRQRLLTAARLPALKSLTGFDYSSVKFPEDYGREELTSLDFINRAEDLVLYGDVGTGKTHLASALIAAACQQGIPARFYTTSSLVMQLRRAKDEGRLDRELVNIAKNQLLAIDEFGYLPIDTEGARLLFQVIADGYEKRSLIITTNLEFSRWGTVFGDDNMAAAVIDRIVHHGRLLQFRGESYRVKHALMK
ncbi:IS21-like element helper ATPase IstB [Cryobacterium sp. 10I1]|uniref:IS21-like element helper ATPase IstB n=1 Tax=unclassified Cryobacterium TaxID=2649013 RepID=UPI002AB413BF|nr:MULTISPECIES: IS21-like element helper ATPase IstB [unclassified Cryobacterium]MDY7544418.1 IS21-like element helper ATPase IstB [Cryobacterium sp. 5B3]MEB0003221.1 IS21-like element helper ATPase IstB [Cryobacterium sp. RTC2.1]MEB0268003.1 IS21-like element helper ATPase IstB [Cryobacterium sp. 10I5]MEB0275513.1 IS21-like element helper ATPase IstB [Cryobacterium sp. 5B3]MEB0288707.1 IS21-like element helper ATPase IstB [Cryobacterium sp. 10S3]